MRLLFLGGQGFGLVENQTSLCTLLRAQSSPICHAFMQGGLFFRRQVIEIVGHGQPFVFLSHANLRPVWRQGRQRFFLLWLKGLPSCVLRRLSCRGVSAGAGAFCSLRGRIAQSKKEQAERNGEKPVYFQSDTFAEGGLDFRKIKNPGSV